MLGGRPYGELMKLYIADHQNPTNKAFHIIGIPTVVVTIVLWLLAPYFEGLWVWAAILTPIGIAMQLIGHRYEGKPPSATNDWRFLIIGVAWWVRAMRGKA
jgi:uncharacterized membrane protein YGL010W